MLETDHPVTSGVASAVARDGTMPVARDAHLDAARDGEPVVANESNHGLVDGTKIAAVLGSGLQADGTATEVTRIRALAAAAFVLANPMKLVASGSRSLNDAGLHGKTEALAMKEIAVAAGVPEDSVLLEEDSLDTLGNGIFTAHRYLREMRPGALYVITSPFHMERALYIFRQVLGLPWTVVGHCAPEWTGETRQAGSAEAMERARRFFDGIAAGDIDACLARLKTHDAYKRLAA